MVTLESLLGARPTDGSHHRRPGATTSLAHANVDRECSRLVDLGIDLGKEIRIFDCDASKSWCGLSKLTSPCLTRSGTKGLRLSSRGRRLRPAEAWRLQLIDVAKF